MVEGELNNTTTTNLNSLNTFSFGTSSVDVLNEGNTETEWTNPDWEKNLSYYKKDGQTKSSIDSMAMWVTGKGYEASVRTKAILNFMRGMGDDNFTDIMRNHELVTMVNGDAYTEIIRNDNGDLINLKPIDPSQIKIVYDKNGQVTRYEVKKNSTWKRLKVSQVLHSSENRISSEIHGTSRLDAIKWMIDAKRQAMEDWKRLSHRSTVRILYVAEGDTTRTNTLRTQYKEAIDKGEVMVLPIAKGEAQFEDLTLPPIQAFLEWIRYLDNLIQKHIGVPDIILGGSQNYTEASSKVGYLTFEQPYVTRQRKLEKDLFQQVGLKITFNRPVSLKEDVQDSETKNTGQVGFQPNDTQVGVGRTE